MTYDYELKLIQQKVVTDPIEEPKVVETVMTVLCRIRSIGRSEFYQAAAAGLRPEAIFVIHQFEYAGEELVEFDGDRFNVLRTYQTGTEEIELTCEKVIGDG